MNSAEYSFSEKPNTVQHSNSCLVQSSTCHNPFIGQDVHIESLEEELFKLKESTKEALHKTWDEVEAVNIKMENQQDTIMQLKQELEQSQLNGRQWQERCLKAESKLADNRRNLLIQSEERQGPSSTSLSSIGSIGSVIFGWAAKSKNATTGISDEIPPTTSTNTLPTSSTITAEYSSSSSFSEIHYREFLLEKDRNIRALEAKIAARDTVIESMEETAEQHVRSIHTTQNEMHHLTEQLRAKKSFDTAQNYSDNENIAQLQTTINNLQDEIENNNAIIKEQELKIASQKGIIMEKKAFLSIHHEYIDEISNELKNSLNTIQTTNKENEQHLNDQSAAYFQDTIKRYKDEVDAKNTIIREQELKLHNKKGLLCKYRKYIEELSNELRNALKIIKNKRRRQSG